MTTLNVQFTDSTEATIVAYFGCAQNPAVWANTGTVDSSDARWATYYNSITTSMQPYLPVPKAS